MTSRRSQLRGARLYDRVTPGPTNEYARELERQAGLAGDLSSLSDRTLREMGRSRQEGEALAALRELAERDDPDILELILGESRRFPGGIVADLVRRVARYQVPLELRELIEHLREAGYLYEERFRDFPRNFFPDLTPQEKLGLTPEAWAGAAEAIHLTERDLQRASQAQLYAILPREAWREVERLHGARMGPDEILDRARAFSPHFARFPRDTQENLIQFVTGRKPSHRLVWEPDDLELF